MKIVPNKKMCAALVCALTFLPHLALASSVYVQTNHSEFFVGDSILFSVRIDTEGKDINAVEGEIVLDHAVGAASLVDLNTSGSAFSLWPGKPLPSLRNTRVSFAGGSPGGLPSEDATIFNVVLKLEEAGQIALSPDYINVYLNDGNGTTDTVSVKNLVIDVLPERPDGQSVDDWSSIIANDSSAPEPFEIYAGQDDSVFDGRKFISFGTTDAQSGISYYEVTEGTLPPVRSADTYVLQEQHEPVRVTVIAYDAAGNARESVYNSPIVDGSVADTKTPYGIFPIILGLIACIIILLVAFKRIRKAKK